MAQTARERIGAPAPPSWRAELDQALTRGGACLTAEAIVEARERGRSMTLPEAIALALAASSGEADPESAGGA